MSSEPLRIRLRFPKIGDRVRFAISYAGAWRPLGWLRVARDGSVYLGLLLGRPAVAKFAAGPVSREIIVRDDDFKDVPVPPSSRLSFKASGEIHLGDKVLQGRSLASLSGPRMLCLIRFAHPSCYRPPSKKKPNEYDVSIADYTVDETKPMYGCLILAPLPSEVSTLPGKLPNMESAATFALGYRGLSCGLDLIVQVIVGHGPSGPWPAFPSAVATSSTAPK